jgi:membrane protein DedA with SNARE-associated domain
MAAEKFSIKLITFLSGFDGFTAYSVILGVLFICGMGVPIPEDITLIAAGILAALGNISFGGAMITGFVGVLAGDCILFFLGRFYGYRVFKLPGFKKIFTEVRIEKSRQRILANSAFICFTARFLPGLRAPIYLTAGIMGVSPIKFLCLDGIAALISVPIWIYLGFYLGENIDHALNIAGKAQIYIIAGVAVLILSYVLIKIRTNKKLIAPTNTNG